MATAVAAAATLGIGTVAFAAVGGADVLGMSSDGDTLVPITEVREIENVVVVVSGSSTPVVDGTETTGAGAPVATDPTPTADGAAVTQPATRPVIVIPVPSAGTPTTAKPTVTTAAKPTVTTAAPVTVTTAKPVVTTTTAKPVTPTTTYRPPGVPADWPAGKPIPPMPAGCEDPQLELNGVWNCDD